MGGAVRDLLRNPNFTSKDIDIATSASPRQILDIFQIGSFVGEAFGVCLVPMGEHCFEVATFRVEGEYLDKRHPSVVLQGSKEQDSERRDFTMNALYYDPLKKTLYDPHGGVKDIKKKIIRCVGEASKRMEEDALRVLRALRFSADFKFFIEKSTLQAIRFYSHQLVYLPRERILLEFKKAKNFIAFVNILIHCVDLKIFFPHLSVFEERAQIKKNSVTLAQSPTIFLRFLVALNCFYKIESTAAFIEELKMWPLEKKDLSLCQEFLKLQLLPSFLQDQLADKKEAGFFLYWFLLKINRIEAAANALFKSLIKEKIHSLLDNPFFLYLSTPNEGLFVLPPGEAMANAISKVCKEIQLTALFLAFWKFEAVLSVPVGDCVSTSTCTDETTLIQFVHDNHAFVKKMELALLEWSTCLV